MKLNIQGVNPEAEDLKQFRQDWMNGTMQENIRVSGNPKAGRLSTLQAYTIDLFCGIAWPKEPEVLGSILAGQTEMEALVRGRQLALVAAFNRGEIGPAKTTESVDGEGI